ncbi:MAG: hypothetical protein F6K47_04815 [Symploca sp. SIO2E6]|nr:hypothetical protein [Symploca sp. SIO2E6]
MLGLKGGWFICRELGIGNWELGIGFLPVSIFISCLHWLLLFAIIIE